MIWIGTTWTDDDVQQLRELAEGNTPTGVISLKLGRSEEAVRAKAQSEGSRWRRRTGHVRRR